MITASTTPGALLGHRKDGRPFYLSPVAPATATEPTPPPTTTRRATPPDPPERPRRTAEPAAPSHPPAAKATHPGEEDVDERSRKAVAAIREDFKTERGKRQAAEKKVTEFAAQLEEMQAASTKQLDDIAKALGLKPDDTPPDPADLTRRLEGAQAEASKRADAHRMAEIKLAVYQAASGPDIDADAEVLLDSASFLRRLEGLDPDGEGFSGQVRDLIAEAIETTPRYKRTPPAPGKPTPAVTKSGGEFTGGQGGVRQWTEADVERATPPSSKKRSRAGCSPTWESGPPARPADQRHLFLVGGRLPE